MEYNGVKTRSREEQKQDDDIMSDIDLLESIEKTMTNLTRTNLTRTNLTRELDNSAAKTVAETNMVRSLRKPLQLVDNNLVTGTSQIRFLFHLC